MSDVTQILNAIERGNTEASESLLPLVYTELRRLAAQRLIREGAGQTLQATALVHEAYVKLVDGEHQQRWDSRGHFFAAGAEAMRRILVDNARRKRRLKRGGDLVRRDFNEAALAESDNSFDLLALDEALERFAKKDPAKCELVKLRFFAGLTIPQAAVHGADEASLLYKIDVDTGTASEIGPLGFAEVDGLAWRKGELFAVTSRLGGHQGRLLAIDVETGKTRQIGAALPLGDLDSLTFDDRGRLLTTDGMGLDDKIYELDLRGAAKPKPLASTPPIINNSRDIEGLTLAADGMLYGVTHRDRRNTLSSERTSNGYRPLFQRSVGGL